MNVMEAARRMLATFYAERVFNATVDSTSGGLVKIKRLDQAAADGEFYPAASGLAATVSNGDIVMCMVVGGHVQVVMKVVTS